MDCVSGRSWVVAEVSSIWLEWAQASSAHLTVSQWSVQSPGDLSPGKCRMEEIIRSHLLPFSRWEVVVAIIYLALLLLRCSVDDDLHLYHLSLWMNRSGRTSVCSIQRLFFLIIWPHAQILLDLTILIHCQQIKSVISQQDEMFSAEQVKEYWNCNLAECLEKSLMRYIDNMKEFANLSVIYLNNVSSPLYDNVSSHSCHV